MTKRGRKLHQTRARKMRRYWPGFYWGTYANRVKLRANFIVDMKAPSELLSLLPMPRIFQAIREVNEP